MMNAIATIAQQTKKLRLLYVEDSDLSRESTLEILQEFFDTIIVAKDGEEGLEKYKNSHIDLIITDINMPKMNGLEMLREIKKIDEDVIGLVLSAHDQSDFFIDSIDLGVEGYLLKPIIFKQFIEALKKVVFIVEGLHAKVLLGQYKAIADASSILTVIDKNKNITYVNEAFCTLSGYSQEELIGAEYMSILGYFQDQHVYDDIWEILNMKKEIYQGILKYVSKKSEKVFYLDTTIKPIVDKYNEVVEYIALRYDVTAIMNPHRRLLDFIASSDAPFVALLRLEDFDTIVDLYGEQRSLDMQDKFSRWLSIYMRKRTDFHIIYMLGDGEYALAVDMKNIDKSDQELIESLKKAQKEINEIVIHTEELEYEISVVFSIAYESEPFDNAKYGLEQLPKIEKKFIVANDLATHIHNEAEKNMRTLHMVKTAIHNHKIISYFQPIINNKTKKIEKYESLVRLVDENDDVIAPFFFLDISKKANYYIQITSIVIDNSIKVLQSIEEDISINISVLDILNDTIRNKIITLLQESPELAKRITLELLEDEGIDDITAVDEFILQVKAFGVQIAIDDFGAGYSNFARLLKFHPDIVKIDGSLVKNIQTDELSLSIVRTIVAFAREQNWTVVAEYVENEEIYNILHALGVDYSQGYYFGKPEALL